MGAAIYKHTSPEGKVYIGISRSDDIRYLKRDRWQSKGQGYRRSNKQFWEDIQKFGWDKFQHEILESGIQNNDELLIKEKMYIYKYKSNNPLYGYNSPNAGKAIFCIDTGKVYYSTKHIEKELGIKQHCIYACLKGTTKSAGRLHWRYATENDREEE